MAGKKKADLKVVILGEASVGKTTLMYRYIEGLFQDQISTIGASFFLKQWGPHQIALWDTAGEERFSGLSALYCRGAAAAILAFDPTKASSFNCLKERFVPLLESANPNCLVVVVATKIDLANDENPREIAYEQGLTFARRFNAELNLNTIPYFETSSKTGANISRTFEYIFQYCLPLEKKKSKGPVHIRPKQTTGVNLDQEQQGFKDGEKTGCC